ncbi:MAG: hypothetical protein ACOC4J_01230, partial [Bacteroidota bacterium]
MLSFKSILFRFSASLACILLINISYIAAQEQLFTGRLEASGGYITPDRMPFWLRSNQFGDVPLSNASMNYAGSLRKEYSKNDQPLWDWKAGINSKVY